MVRYYPEELMHYGIKGMKWGVRRYQNEDGTRTELGKMRERKGDGKGKKIAKKVGKAAGILGALVVGSSAIDQARGKPMGKKPKMSEEDKDFWFTADQADGKDKPKTSRAEQIARKGTKAFRDAGNVSRRVFSKQAERERYEQREKLRKEASRMSDDELRKRINRLNLEKQYIDLNSYSTPDGRWSMQDKMDLGLDAVEVLTGLGSLAISIAGIKGTKAAWKTAKAAKAAAAAKAASRML